MGLTESTTHRGQQETCSKGSRLRRGAAIWPLPTELPRANPTSSHTPPNPENKWHRLKACLRRPGSYTRLPPCWEAGPQPALSQSTAPCTLTLPPSSPSPTSGHKVSGQPCPPGHRKSWFIVSLQISPLGVPGEGQDSLDSLSQELVFPPSPSF